jgi:hypothetical protein
MSCCTYPRTARGIESVYYLLVACEDSGIWHEADQCEADSLRHAETILRNSNPRLWKHTLWAVVAHHDLEEALARPIPAI